MKKIQSIRNSIQVVFLVLLMVGVFMQLKMVIVLFLPASLFFGNFFCGWVCPFGTAQEIFGTFGSFFIKKKLKMPKAIQKYLRFSRYIIFTVSTIGVGAIFFESINAYAQFQKLFSVADIAVNASLIIMISLLIISMFFERPFCNYVCTEGVKFGVLSLARVYSIKRNEDTCVSCKKCDNACPMNITISENKIVRNAQCINCFECISACPVPNTLTYSKVGWELNTKKSEKK